MNRQELNQLIDDYAMAFADAEKARMIKGLIVTGKQIGRAHV